eukprot:365124-Chlamydomonas_euryale.AAC.3
MERVQVLTDIALHANGLRSGRGKLFWGCLVLRASVSVCACSSHRGLLCAGVLSRKGNDLNEKSEAVVPRCIVAAPHPGLLPHGGHTMQSMSLLCLLCGCAGVWGCRGVRLECFGPRLPRRAFIGVYSRRVWQSLELEGNAVTDVGGLAMCKAAKGALVLSRLNLSLNALTDATMHAMADALRFNTGARGGTGSGGMVLDAETGGWGEAKSVQAWMLRLRGGVRPRASRLGC